MNSNIHPFNFDVNWNFAVESVFTDVYADFSLTIVPPPVEGYFLELAGPPLLLLNGQNLTLL